MDWRQERKASLESSMEKIVKLLGECEQNLICESDPKDRSKLESQISELKKGMSQCESDLISFEYDNAQRNHTLTMAGINYEDMNFVITALLNQTITSATSSLENFYPTDPGAKMSKNDLTHEMRFTLGMGFAKAGEVRHFIENNAKINFPDLPDRLKASLNAEYIKLMQSGVRGNTLFNMLYSFSHQNNPNPARQLAGLAVLCYFFEACDVFEP
jgi:hypothetical protein